MQIARRYRRWRIEKEAKVKLAGAAEFITCLIGDISFMGAKIILPLKLPPDTFIKIVIGLTEDALLEVEAWVVWHKHIDGHNIYGFYFTKIKDPDKEKIYQFVRQNFPQELNRQWWQGTTEEKGGEEMEDRRIFDRFKAQFPVRFLDLRHNKECVAHTVDVSAKGVGLVTNEAITPRTPLEMWLEIPDKGEPLYTRGEVAWSRKIEPAEYRVGVNLEKADLMGLSRVLRVS